MHAWSGVKELREESAVNEVNEAEEAAHIRDLQDKNIKVVNHALGHHGQSVAAGTTDDQNTNLRYGKLAREFQGCVQCG